MQLESNNEVDFENNGNQTALFELFGKAIFGYLRLHARTLEDAEDLLLEVFVATLEHDNLTALPPHRQLAWLKRVAHNKLINLYRHASRHPQVTLDSTIETIFAHENPEQLLLRQEERKQLQDALLKLPALQRQILQLRYGDGLHCPEIAVLLNKREEAVRKLLSRSILYLRQVYHHIEEKNDATV